MIRTSQQLFLSLAVVVDYSCFAHRPCGTLGCGQWLWCSSMLHFTRTMRGLLGSWPGSLGLRRWLVHACKVVSVSVSVPRPGLKQAYVFMYGVEEAHMVSGTVE